MSKETVTVEQEDVPKGVKLTCKNCDNTWTYRGKSIYYATCTRCLRKVKVPKPKK